MDKNMIDSADVLEIIKSSLEVDHIESTDDALDQYDWDSIAIIGFLSAVNEQFKVVVLPKDVARAVSIQDLINLLVK